MGYIGAETDPSSSKLVKICDSNLKGQKVFRIAKVLVKFPSKHSSKCTWPSCSQDLRCFYAHDWKGSEGDNLSGHHHGRFPNALNVFPRRNCGTSWTWSWTRCQNSFKTRKILPTSGCWKSRKKNPATLALVFLITLFLIWEYMEKLSVLRLILVLTVAGERHRLTNWKFGVDTSV